MGTRAMAKSNHAGIVAAGGEKKSSSGAMRRAECIKIGDTISTSQDFANFMSAMIGDIVSGRIDPRTANAACNAGGKLLHVVEMEHKYGRRAEKNSRVLQLAQA